MSSTVSFITAILQAGLTFVILMGIYMLFAFLDLSDFDLPSAIGFVMFQPLFALLLSLASVFFCFLIGLPIRLSGSLRSWWIHHQQVSVLGILMGLGLLIAALFLQTQIRPVSIEPGGMKTIPHPTFAICGWLLTAFSSMHFFPVSIIRALAQKSKA